jgi:hypothetical protein
MKKKNSSNTHTILLVALLFALGILALTIKHSLPAILYSQSPIPTEHLAGVYDTTDTDGVFYGKSISSLQTNGALLVDNILVDTTDNKRIEVDLTSQRLYAYEGDKKVYDFLISSGKWGRTPTCSAEENCRIWIKLRYTKMSGGSKELGTYYYLPNVPFTMYFSGKHIPRIEDLVFMARIGTIILATP